MNSTKLFHFNYLKQNLKKSRIVLSFVLLLLPILNLLVFFMGNTDTKINVYDLTSISHLTILGLFIIPIVLSLILFNYVFKKKSIDFMGSMPINRKSIFITNTVGGIVIIVLLLFTTSFLMFLSSIFMANIYIPFGVFIDYFVFFSLSYIFLFVVCNLAISLAGNVATTLVITALIVFLAPFIHFVYTTTHLNMTNLNYKAGNNQVSLNSNTYYTQLSEIAEYHYTTPSQVIVQTMAGEEGNGLYLDSSMGRMALLTVLYFLVGLSIFQKKELEVCETSFKNFYVHLFVKALTMVPIMVFIYEVTRYSSFVTLLFALCLVLVYSFVYDLITRKGITRVGLSLVAFLISVVALYPVSYFLINTNSEQEIKNITIVAGDIDGITFFDANLSSLKQIGGVYKTKDKKIYDIILSSSGYDDEDEERPVGKIKVYVNGKAYGGYLYLTKEEIKTLENLITSSKTYKDALANRLKDYDVATLGSDYVELNAEDVKLLEKALDNPDQEKNDFYLPIHVYTYKNHKLERKMYYSNLNKELNQKAVNRYNEKFREAYQNKEVKSCGYLVVEDEYSGNSNYYHDTKCMDILTSLMEQANSDVSERLYQLSIYDTRENNSYFYYLNLTDEQLSKLNMLDMKTEKKEDADIDVH